jgi:hypothetical protein
MARPNSLPAHPEPYSISIIPRLIPAAPAPAASFIPPNRKRLASAPWLNHNCSRRGVSDLG